MRPLPAGQGRPSPAGLATTAPASVRAERELLPVRRAACATMASLVPDCVFRAIPGGLGQTAPSPVPVTGHTGRVNWTAVASATLNGSALAAMRAAPGLRETAADMGPALYPAGPVPATRSTAAPIARACVLGLWSLWQGAQSFSRVPGTACVKMPCAPSARTGMVGPNARSSVPSRERTETCARLLTESAGTMVFAFADQGFPAWTAVLSVPEASARTSTEPRVETPPCRLPWETFPKSLTLARCSGLSGLASESSSLSWLLSWLLLLPGSVAGVILSPLWIMVARWGTQRNPRRNPW